MKVYYDKDANLNAIKKKQIGIIGYGSQGHAHALNLRDSSMQVMVAALPKSATWKRVQKDGLPVGTIDEVAKASDIMTILLPDELQARLYKSSIEPYLQKGNVLVFAHGFNIHYNQIVPPPDVDVIMVAPKGPGHLVRRTFMEGSGVPCLICIEQDVSKKAKAVALAYARGIGGTRAGAIETTFREETETDLFGEQVVLCGGVVELMKAGFETLVNAGYKPEMAYFECLHEMKLIVDLIYEGGIVGMNDSISNTAEYGELTRGPQVIDWRVREKMREILADVQSGAFAREWILENQANQPVFKALRKQMAAHPAEATGKILRKMMSWLKKKK